MTSRERLRALIGGEPADRCGFWLGMPHADSWPAIHAHFGTAGDEELRRRLGDDFRWISPQFFADAYRDPDGHALFDAGLNKASHGMAGPFADCDDPAAVEAIQRILHDRSEPSTK